MQAHWAVWYYETYGYWTSVNSAIAVWAMRHSHAHHNIKAADRGRARARGDALPGDAAVLRLDRRPHPCAYFAEWGFYHSYDYGEAGPPPAAGIQQPRSIAASAAGAGDSLGLPQGADHVRRHQSQPARLDRVDRNAIHPYFEDYLQYAHYFRYRAPAKLRIPRNDYGAARRPRRPADQRARPRRGRATIAVERDPVTMYAPTSRCSTGWRKQGWAGHKLAVGEDLSYANMVACASARWVLRPNPDDPSMPLMGAERAQASSRNASTNALLPAAADPEPAAA